MPVLPPVQLAEATAELFEVDEYVRASQARDMFQVNGKGFGAAVLDTGANVDHVDFAGRIVAKGNFTTDDDGDLTNVQDGNGHGTNVAGIVLAGQVHMGMAPGASFAPLKVLRNDGGGSFAIVERALDWVLQTHATYNISVVCMSLSDGGNYVNDDFPGNSLRAKVQELHRRRVPVVVAAGNEYFRHQSRQGMAFPAILRECISVGAVYDANLGMFEYPGGAIAFSTRPGQITPFSQRLHQSVSQETHTDIFAPGAPVISTGIDGPYGESVQQGTSQAEPVVAGVILLIQELYQRTTGSRPTVEEIVTFLRRGALPIVDGDDEHDNVEHSGLTYGRLDAVRTLDAVRRELVKRRLARPAQW
ncbi:MAG: S8 family serine peptidase [Anaerolineales bacterium]|nr:S8 family serine peptidase [Anaerolineales bacterium]